MPRVLRRDVCLRGSGHELSIHIIGIAQRVLVISFRVKHSCGFGLLLATSKLYIDPHCIGFSCEGLLSRIIIRIGVVEVTF